jgi:CubicO group peptidase (beta-lactamase class C family)
MSYFMLMLLLISACGRSSSPLVTGESSPVSFSAIAPNIPGHGTVVLKGETEEISVSGVRKWGTTDLIQKDDAFHLGSNTKAITATLAAILVEEQHLNWTSTLGQLLPEMEIHPLLREVTFDYLLAHRAGLPKDTETSENNWLFKELHRLGRTPQESRLFYTEAILKRPPLHHPGSQFYYSNAGYMVAGFILEKITGKSWEDLMVEKLFHPLQMHSCHFGAPPVIWGHRMEQEKILSARFDNPPAFRPAGGIHCSLKDWSRFLHLHLQGFNGEAKLLTSSSFKKLHQLFPDQQSYYTFGGWIRVYRSWAGGDVLTHSGSNTYHFSQVWLAPRRQRGFVTVYNSAQEGIAEIADKMITKLIGQNL